MNFEYIPITTSETTCDNSACLFNTENTIPIKSEDKLQASLSEYLPESNEAYIPILSQAGTSPNHSPDEIATLSEVKYSPEPDGTKIEHIPVSTDTGMIEESNEPTLECLTSCQPGYKDEDNDYQSKPFPFQKKCFFCEKDFSTRQLRVPNDPRNRNYPITEKNQLTILNRLSKAFTQQGEAVFQRIKNVNLLELGARFHLRCYTRMSQMTWDTMSRQQRKMRRKASRPVTAELQAALETIYRYIEESERTTFTIAELARLSKKHQPTTKTLKAELQKKYGKKIYFSNIGNKYLCTILKRVMDFGGDISLPLPKKKKGINFIYCIICQLRKKNEHLRNALGKGYIRLKESVATRKKYEDSSAEDLFNLFNGHVTDEELRNKIKWHKNCYSSFTSNANIKHLQKRFQQSSAPEVQKKKESEERKEVRTTEDVTRKEVKKEDTTKNLNIKDDDHDDVQKNKDNEKCKKVKNTKNVTTKINCTEDKKEDRSKDFNIKDDDHDDVRKINENEKCKKVRKSKNVRTKEVNIEDNKEDLTIKKQDNDDDFINKDDDDDGFFADWLDPFSGEFTDEVHEENSKENRSSFICRICLSSDRKLGALDDYRDIYRSMCVDTVEEADSKQFLACWECKALLRNVKRFQNKIKTAQKLWNNEGQLKCLSTLSIPSPFSSVSYTPESLNSEVYVEVIQFVKRDTEEMEIKPEYLEKLSPDHNTEESQEKQNNTDRDDMDSDSAEDTERPKRKLRRKTTNEEKKRGSEENSKKEETDRPRRKLRGRTTNESKKRRREDNYEKEDNERPRRKLRRKTTNEARKRSSSEENGEIDDEVMLSERDGDTSSTEISDWEPSSNRTPTKKHKQIYTIKDLNYNARKKMKRIAIPPYELDHWRERERNSVYFESLKSNKCLTCLSEVTEDHDVVFHSKTHPHICSVCESCFSTEEDLHAHIENHYYIYSCNICGYQCYNELHMCDHADRHRTVLQCLECNAIKQTYEILRKHYNEIHRYSQCDYCKKRFHNKMFLEKHIQRKHMPLECTICHITFPTHFKKYSHMKLKHLIERTEAAYCVQCDIQFNNESLLKRHVNTSTKHASEWTRDRPKKQQKPKEKQKQQLKCPECPNVYASKTTLRGHVDFIHKHKVNFYCNACQKAFSHRDTYKKHIRGKHEGFRLPKNKFCHICGRGFSSKTTLVHHIRTHTGERPHACALCAARFAQKVALTSHVKHVHDKKPRQIN